MSTRSKKKSGAERAEAEAARFREVYGNIKAEVGRMMVGQDEVVQGVLTALFAGGHVLLEGVPGLGKTLLVRCLGDAVDLSFSRIQFTPDLMPADIRGSEVLTETKSGATRLGFHEGPLVANLVLADEINRATPKTQSALLEAMQEKQISVGKKTITLDEPYCVMATQNPVEQEGTYPLPEAQLDRFLVKLVVDYPAESDYAAILDRTTSAEDVKLEPVSSAKEILSLRNVVRSVPVPEHVQNYAVRLVMATQPRSPYAPEVVDRCVSLGSSPRGAQALLLAGKVQALLEGRYAVSTEDLRAAAPACLRHRIMLGYQAAAEGVDAEAIVEAVLKVVKPRIVAS